MLTFFRNVGRGILFSNLFIAACAFSLVWQTYLLLQLPVQLWLAWLAFLATFLIYNLDGLLPYKFNQNIVISERKLWLVHHRSLLLESISLAGIISFYLFIRHGQTDHVWFIAHLVIISLLYSLRIIPQKNGTFMPLRNVPLVKVFLIAYVWSCVTVILPLQTVNLPIFTLETGVLLLRRFSFLFALTLLFDIRDFEKDRITSTLTFPGLFGVRLTKVFSLFLLLIFAVLTYFTEKGNVLLSLELSAVIAALVVWFSHEKRSDYYFLILADGMMLLQFFLVYLAVSSSIS
ncbi:UbiA prenyltransferase family protein [Adhaeribacter radiodurans]|uniref:UbiA family prenyltransferase n=1 Tax=Adhaeribacter radiodurans TaxID=2745197 RepID=A0A7L7L281_9BACT|nr:hypothetical protein [Adhaeribacter radiodurans]QMU26906.1 hypothetical protein HUW48_02150 [Adhaeribacter radiodurans]